MNHRIKPTRATTSSKFRRFVVLVLVLVALMAVGFIATRERGPAEAAVDTSSRTDSGPDRLGAPERTNAADKELRTLTVSVVDESEQPVQGARVCLLVAGRAVSAQSCALTDSSGFVDDFELPNGERWRVSTSAEGFRPSIVPRPGELRPSGDRVRVTLRRGGVRLTGIVEDATGGTIEGALVSVEDAIGLGVAAARSGEAGEFELWASSGHVVVNATADGYVAAQEHLVLPSGPVRLVLLPESIISGRVLEANSGEPIADAIVIGRSTADDGRTRLDNATFSTQSGEDGRYELRGLSAGVFGLSSRGPQGFGTSEGGVVVEFGSQVEDVDILVHRGTRLRVRVVVTATKQGCPGALVSLLEENTGHGLTATTDQDGRVELSVPVAGDYRADVTCTGQRVVGEAPIIELSGDPNDSETLEIAVESGLLSQGIVVSATDGTPVAEAVVALIPLHGRAPAAVAVADPEGRVELSGLDAGEYVATGSAPGWFPGDSTVTVSVPSDASFELGLHAGGSLTGSVLESDGTPVPSARVLAHRRSVNGRWRGETLVDGQGRYEFSALPPGTYEIDVRSEGGQPLSTPGGSASSATVSIDGGVFAEQHFIVAAQDGTIAGTVVDGEGSPITTAFVCAEPDQPPRDAVARGQCSPRMTDIDGHFLIRGLSQGQFTLTGRVRGGGEASLAGVAPGDDVKLIVQATGSLRGGAHFRSDGSVPDFLVVEVVREDAAIRRREVFLRTRGRWSLAGLPFGDYHVRIKASRGAGAAKIEIGEGVTNAGDIGLDDVTSLSGRVTRLETGEPIEGFRVVATALDAQLRSRYTRDDRRNVSGADGRFVVSDPPTGRVTLHVIPENLDARPPDLTEAHLTVTVNPGVPLDVGDVAIPTRRLEPDQPRAAFGFGLDRWNHVGDQAERVAEVVSVVVGGPATQAGLQVGDVIIAIDGYDIVGRRYILQYLLARPVGTTIKRDTERALGLVLLGR